MKKNNNKNIILISIIIGIIIIGIIYVILYLNRDEEEENISKEKNNTEEKSPVFSNKFTIESTDDNPIKKDNIEVEKINISHINGSLEIETILKNNSNEEIKGFFIIIGIYDEKGKELTNYALNTEDTIPANKTYNLKNYATINKEVKIVTAKILHLDGNVAKKLEENFEPVE